MLGQHHLSNKRITDEDKCLRMSLLSKRRQTIILTLLIVNRKHQYPKNIPVITRPTISEVGRVVTGLFEYDLLNHERQFGNSSYLQ